MRKLLCTVAGRFSPSPPERLPAIVDDVTPASVSTICIPARSVLVNPELSHTGAKPVVRMKRLFTAVGATFGQSRLRFHWDQLSFRGLDLNSSGVLPIRFTASADLPHYGSKYALISLRLMPRNHRRSASCRIVRSALCAENSSKPDRS